jgi:hypothetical protein
MELEKLLEQARAPKISDFGNQVLYDLCAGENFLHREPGIVCAKVWLIGRAYAAALERRKGAIGISDDFYEKEVVACFLRSNIDEWLLGLKSFDHIEDGNEFQILQTHKRLVERIKQELTRLKNISFASKYLHFHLPHVFFIYDGRASDALGPLAKELGIAPPKTKSGDDSDYARFFRKARVTKAKLEQEYGHAMSLRQFDNLLVELANQKARKKSLTESKRPDPKSQRA